MINKGDNPEGTMSDVNKFIAPGGEGMRGYLIAVHENGTEAIMLAANSSVKGDVAWGRFYHVQEAEADQYPRVTREVHYVPSTDEWTLCLEDA